MQVYEYVPKREYSPVKRELETIILKVKKIMKEMHGIEFYFELIGSGKRHLITRIKGGNKGFDLDYNLVLIEDYRHRPKKMADWFMSAFLEAVKGNSFSEPKDRTSVINIRTVDVDNNRVLYGGDFAIVCYEDDEDEGYKYLKHWDDGHYSFEKRGHSRNADWKLDYIDYECENGWSLIREEYLKLKNRNNDINKHSFELYLEAIHNVYNHIMQLNRHSI